MTAQKKVVSDRSQGAREVAVRWTPALAKAGWTPVADYFLHNYHRLAIRHAEAMFLVHLISYKWTAEAPFPRFGTIAQQMGVSLTAVRAYARNLERGGLLRRECNVGSTNRFFLDPLFNKLELLQAEDVRVRRSWRRGEPTQTPLTDLLAKRQGQNRSSQTPNFEAAHDRAITLWGELIETVREQRRPIQAIWLKKAGSVRLVDDLLILGFPLKEKAGFENLRKPASMASLEGCLRLLGSYRLLIQLELPTAEAN